MRVEGVEVGEIWGVGIDARVVQPGVDMTEVLGDLPRQKCFGAMKIHIRSCSDSSVSSRNTGWDAQAAP